MSIDFPRISFSNEDCLNISWEGKETAQGRVWRVTTYFERAKLSLTTEWAEGSSLEEILAMAVISFISRAGWYSPNAKLYMTSTSSAVAILDSSHDHNTELLPPRRT